MKSDFASKALALGLALFLPFFTYRIARFVGSDLRVVVWDVGQGDGIWLRFPTHQSWLIDSAGKRGTSSVAARVLMPELAAESVLQVNTLLLSHTDEDHAFGALDLLAQQRVQRLLLHARYKEELFDSPLLHEIRKLAHQMRTPLQWIDKADRFTIGDTVVTVVPYSFGEKKNNQVLVVEVEQSGCRFLFLGDAEREVEKQIARGWPHPVDVLKVAHHGSKTSTTEELIQRLRPRLAVISVGTHNPYGHPHPTVVQRLHRAGVQIFRTDRHGYIELSVSAKRLRGAASDAKAPTIQCHSHRGWCGEYFCRG